MQHTARVKCGKCGHEADIALGHAYSIECIGCKTEIVLGEDDSDTCPHCNSRNTNRLDSEHECYDCGNTYKEKK